MVQSDRLVDALAFAAGWADGGTTSQIQVESLEPLVDVDVLEVTI